MTVFLVVTFAIIFPVIRRVLHVYTQLSKVILGPTDGYMGARRGATWGSCPPWILKMTTPYAGSVQNTVKISLAPSALASNNLKLSLKSSL